MKLQSKSQTRNEAFENNTYVDFTNEKASKSFVQKTLTEFIKSTIDRNLERKNKPNVPEETMRKILNSVSVEESKNLIE